jgi:hypothetical protein
LTSPSALIDRIESIPRRELYFFALYRVLIASLIAALVFSPLSALMSEAHHPALARAVSIGYLPGRAGPAGVGPQRALAAAAGVLGRGERHPRRHPASSTPCPAPAPASP